MADAYTDTLIRLNPSFATELGLPGHETEYPDFSPAGIAEFAAEARKALSALDGLAPRDDVDAVLAATASARARDDAEAGRLLVS